jgi:hypothetical protein
MSEKTIISQTQEAIPPQVIDGVFYRCAWETITYSDGTSSKELIREACK